jgi:hypothetical protein
MLNCFIAETRHENLKLPAGGEDESEKYIMVNYMPSMDWRFWDSVYTGRS